MKKWTSIFDASWRPTWLSKPTQNPPKIDRKSIKNRCRSWCFFEMLSKSVFFTIFCDFLSQLDVQKEPKSVSTNGRFEILFGSWGLLGPRWPQEPILIDFWSIFDDFLTIFGGCLDDFWTIFGRFLTSERPPKERWIFIYMCMCI